MTSFVTNVCLIFLFIVFIELSRYGKFPEFFRKNSGNFPTFYFSGKVTTLDRADMAVTEMQISPVIVNGFENGFHQWIQRIFLVVVEAEKIGFGRIFFKSWIHLAAL